MMTCPPPPDFPRGWPPGRADGPYACATMRMAGGSPALPGDQAGPGRATETISKSEPRPGATDGDRGPGFRPDRSAPQGHCGQPAQSGVRPGADGGEPDPRVGDQHPARPG